MDYFMICSHLEDITQDPKAKMQWAQYFWNVVSRYQVAIEGWPESIPFANLSGASSSSSQLEILLWKWEMGTTYWKELTDEELEELRQKRNTQIEDGEIQEPSRHTHSDKGKKHVRRSSDDPPSRKKYKSAESIVNSDDEQGEEHGLPQTPRSSPAATQGLVVSDANPTATAAVMHQTGLVQWTWKITSISNDPDVKDEHDGASS